MAHPILFPLDTPTPPLPIFSTVSRPRQQSSVSRSDNMPSSARNNSTSSTASSDPSSSSSSSQPQSPIRTRSLAWGTSVVFEREPSPPADTDVMLVTVRLSNPFRRGSKHGAEDLPSRPPARSFIRRLSTRLNMDHSAEREERYKAIKMPRGEYKKFFRRDAEGNYAGTEPEKDWEEEELMERFGEYQVMPVTRLSV